MRYSDAVMEHFLHPRHAGVMNSSDADVGTGEAGSHETGALIRIQLKVSEQGALHLIQGSKIPVSIKESHLCFSIASVDAFIAKLQKADMAFEKSLNIL